MAQGQRKIPTDFGDNLDHVMLWLGVELVSCGTEILCMGGRVTQNLFNSNNFSTSAGPWQRYAFC